MHTSCRRVLEHRRSGRQGADFSRCRERANQREQAGAEAAGAGLPPSIPAGMRAMSVRVNEVIGVAGFVVPGTHVDVMAVLKGQKSDGLARVVVSNVQVLTAGTWYDQENVRKTGNLFRRASSR